MSKHYSKEELYRQAQKQFKCRRPCHHITVSTLPDSDVPQTEVLYCPVCGRGIQFSTVDLPKTVSYPVSRRQWNFPSPFQDMR